MNCKPYERLISKAMEGKLTQKEETKLMVHIKGCAKCARNHARIHEIVHELNQLEEVKLPQDFHQEVMKQIRKVSRTAE